MKKMLLNPFVFLLKLLPLYFILLFFVISCKSVTPEFTKCEEACEYSRRDCIENCGGYNSFGFSIDFGKSGFQTPYACTDKCEKKAASCLERCGEKNNPDE